MLSNFTQVLKLYLGRDRYGIYEMLYISYISDSLDQIIIQLQPQNSQISKNLSETIDHELKHFVKIYF